MKYRRDLWAGWAESELDDLVPLGDSYINRVIDVSFPSVDGQPALSMTIDSSSGVPRCTRLSIEAVAEGREVRTTDIRAVNVQDWIEAIVPAFTHDLVDGGFTIRTDEGEQRQLAADVKRLRTAQRADRRKINDELLRKVAEVYSSDDQHPADAVRRAFPPISRRTAFRYIELARNAGHLPRKG